MHGISQGPGYGWAIKNKVLVCDKLSFLTLFNEARAERLFADKLCSMSSQGTYSLAAQHMNMEGIDANAHLVRHVRTMRWMGSVRERRHGWRTAAGPTGQVGLLSCVVDRHQDGRT